MESWAESRIEEALRLHLREHVLHEVAGGDSEGEEGEGGNCGAASRLEGAADGVREGRDRQEQQVHASQPDPVGDAAIGCHLPPVLIG